MYICMNVCIYDFTLRYFVPVVKNDYSKCFIYGFQGYLFILL